MNPSFGGAYEMLPGVAYLYAGGDSRDANAVTDAILQEAERLAAEGMDEAYFQRIRKASFGANLRGLNSFENIAVTLTEGYFHGYDPLRFPEVFDSITAEDIAAFLKRTSRRSAWSSAALFPSSKRGNGGKGPLALLHENIYNGAAAPLAKGRTCCERIDRNEKYACQLSGAVRGLGAEHRPGGYPHRPRYLLVWHHSGRCHAGGAVSLYEAVQALWPD
ncbi:MAG: hypothetical protein V8R27_04395 [Oscillospiraceae bacterium]